MNESIESTPNEENKIPPPPAPNATDAKDETTKPGVTWNDIVKATADKDASREEREIVEDVLEVKLSERDYANIARANAADDEEKTTRQRTVDDLKSDLKDEKSAIDAIDARMRDRNNTVRKGSESRRAHWIVLTLFAQNAVRYLDPDTGEVVHERALRSDERQVSLPLVSDEAISKAAQVSLGETTETEEGAAVTDPESILDAVKKGEGPTPSDVSLDSEPGEDDGPGYGEDEDDDQDDA